MNKKILFIGMIIVLLIISIISFAKPTFATTTVLTATENTVGEQNTKKCKKYNLQATLQTLLKNGKISQADYDASIKIINQNNGKVKKSSLPTSVQTALKEYRRAKLEEKLKEAVSSGKITQAQAEQKLKDFDNRQKSN